MRDALNATGRPILFSLCGWRKWYGPVGASLGNMWRISLDVIDWFGVYRSAVTRYCHRYLVLVGVPKFSRLLRCVFSTVCTDFLTHGGAAFCAASALESIRGRVAGTTQIC